MASSPKKRRKARLTTRTSPSSTRTGTASFRRPSMLRRRSTPTRSPARAAARRAPERAAVRRSTRNRQPREKPRTAGLFLLRLQGFLLPDAERGDELVVELVLLAHEFVALG